MGNHKASARIAQPSYEGATAEELEHPLVQELLAIHNLFRRELSSMQHYVESVVASDTQLDALDIKQRVQLLSGSAFRYTQILHAHHNAESSALFPRLKQEGLDAAIVTRLEAEHQDLTVLIDQLEATLRNTAAVDPRLLNADLLRLAQVLEAHLAYEETHVCPLLTHFADWSPVTH